MENRNNPQQLFRSFIRSAKHIPSIAVAAVLALVAAAAVTTGLQDLYLRGSDDGVTERRGRLLRGLKALPAEELELLYEQRKECDALRSQISFPYAIVEAKYSDEADDVSFPMAIYDKTEGRSDVVSNWIERWTDWDLEQTVSLITELRERPDKSSLFLDIGANIGWFSLVMAAAGYRVYSVEPNENNRKLLELSACLNPSISANIRVLPYGLGTKSQKCEMWQNPTENVGDTFSMCDDNKDTAALINSGMEKIAEMEVRTLDDLASTGLLDLGPKAGETVVKIDVEGYEYFALKGGEKLLSTSRPRKIFSEFDPSMLNKHKDLPDLSTEYLRLMKTQGYTIHTVGGEEITDITTASLKYPHTDLVFSMPEFEAKPANQAADPSTSDLQATIKSLSEQIQLLSNQVSEMNANKPAPKAV